MKGLVRIAACVPKLHLANPAANADTHIGLLEQARVQHASVVLFP